MGDKESMKNKAAFATAISQVIQIANKQKENNKIDMELFAVACIKEFKLLDLPFFSIAVNTSIPNRISLECPFMLSCHIQIEPHAFLTRDKAAVLYVNGKSVRKIKLSDTNPEYMARIAHALLDFLKKYTLLKNRFSSNSN